MRPLALAGLVVAVGLAGCAGIGSKGSAREGGTIRVGVSSTLDSLDPAVARSAASREVLSLVYTPPVTYARAGGDVKLVPGVAAAVPKALGDGTVYAFRLRRGLLYSDGRPVRAADVAHALSRARALNPAARALLRDVRRVAWNDRSGRVRLVLHRPDPDLPYMLASEFAAPVPSSTPVGRPARRPPPGVGPYEFVRATPHGGFVLRRASGFDLPGLPKGYVTEISVRPGGNAQDVIGGALDYVQGPPPRGLLPDLRSKYRDRYAQHQIAATLVLELDSARPPFDDADVREAVERAIDKQELSVLGRGFLRPTCNLLPPSVAGYERLDPCPWGDPTGEPDLVKARDLVERAAAGRARVSVAAAPRYRRLATEIVSTLRKIGLRARIGRRRSQARLEVLTSAVPTAAALLALPAERTRADPGLGPLADELAAEPDPDRAAKLAAELDRGLVKAAAAVPIGTEERGVLLSARMDSRNCAAFSPMLGADWASFCLR